MPRANFYVVAVTTLDGKIAKNSKHNVDWSSPEDKQHLDQMIKQSDVVIVGSNTYAVAQAALSAEKLAQRNYIILTRSVDDKEEREKGRLFVNPENTDLRQLTEDLGYKNVAILGGGKIYSLMVDKGWVDEIFLTIEPIIFGNGINFIDHVDLNTKFKLLNIKKLNNNGTILLHYEIDSN